MKLARVTSLDDLRLLAHKLLGEPNLGYMGRSIYDSAWVARVPLPDSSRPAFPDVLDYVKRSQTTDGGWEASSALMSSRIISSLASILAITEFDKGKEALAAAKRGVDFITHHWKAIEDLDNITVGFELLSAALIEECCDRGFSLHGLLDEAKQLRSSKLAHVPEHLIYSPRSTLSLSLEWMYDDLDLTKARNLILPNESIGCTPSASAYYARRSGDPRVFRYLYEVVQQYGPSDIPWGTDAHLWALVWVLHPLLMAGLVDAAHDRLVPHIQYIRSNLQDGRLGWSRWLPYTDADVTSCGLYILQEAGHPYEWSKLAFFEHQHGFKVYPEENSPSVSTNANVLMIIREQPYPAKEAAMAKIKALIGRTMKPEGYWVDKWHASPYYATSRVVMALAEDEPEPARLAVDWMLDSQREDGSWGAFSQGTMEETAQALLALTSWHVHHPSNKLTSAIARGYARLETLPIDCSDHPAFWTAKSMYAPLHIIQAQTLAAKAMSLRALNRM